MLMLFYIIDFKVLTYVLYIGGAFNSGRGMSFRGFSLYICKLKKYNDRHPKLVVGSIKIYVDVNIVGTCKVLKHLHHNVACKNLAILLTTCDYLVFCLVL